MFCLILSCKTVICSVSYCKWKSCFGQIATHPPDINATIGRHKNETQNKNKNEIENEKGSSAIHNAITDSDANAEQRNR